MRIVWSREGGATEQRMLAEAKSAQERGLVQNVWRRPGAASTVAAAVETDCLEELARREAGAPMPSQSVGYGVSPGGDRAPQDRSASEEQLRQAQAREAAHQQQICANYGTRMDSLRARERAGGSATTMDRLNEERRRLQAEQSRAGC